MRCQPPTSSCACRELGDAASVAVSPSGLDVYVASSNPGGLTHLCVDKTTGELDGVGWGENGTMLMEGASSVRNVFL